MRYVNDKNGNSIKYAPFIIGANGKHYDLCGTGMMTPGFGDAFYAWDEDNNLVMLKGSQVTRGENGLPWEVIVPLAGTFFVAGLASYLGLL